MTTPEFPTETSAIAEAIGIPLEEWPGNCHGVAEATLKRLPVEGMRMVRGHYTGHVSSKSVYRGSIQQHSWLELGDGRILDPTRWAMDRPGSAYLYVGDNDAYDEGGLAMRAKQRPSFSMASLMNGQQGGKEDAVLKTLQGVDPEILEDMFDSAGLRVPSEVTLRDAERLTSRFDDPVEHFHRPEDFFTAVKKAGLSAMVPIDTMIRVLSPERVNVNRGANMLWEVPAAEETTDAQKLCKVLCRYLSVEEREITIEEELEEIGYTLDDLHGTLNRLEADLIWAEDFSHVSSGAVSTLAVIASELLGKGFGADIEVERFAKSIGLDRDALHRTMVSMGERAGYDLPWLTGDDADRAMSVIEDESPSPM
jgi:hypothetical protein